MAEGLECFIIKETEYIVKFSQRYIDGSPPVNWGTIGPIA